MRYYIFNSILDFQKAAMCTTLKQQIHEIRNVLVMGEIVHFEGKKRKGTNFAKVNFTSTNGCHSSRH